MRILLKELSGVQAATKHQSFHAMRIPEEVFQPVWLEPEYKLKGKRDCFSLLKSKNLYSLNSRALVNTILLAAEHQMALGPDERNQITHFWEGDISIEHVLPQVRIECYVESNSKLYQISGGFAILADSA